MAEIEAATPWAALVTAVLPYYPKGDGCGRPLMGLECMLRIYIAQQCFGLSGEGIEDRSATVSPFEVSSPSI